MIERSISKKVGRAIADYKMIEDGDRILVAVSGGKDSLTLLKILSDRKSFVPVKYDVLAIHVDLGYTCINKEALKKFLQDKGYAFQIKKIDVLKGRSREEITLQPVPIKLIGTGRIPPHGRKEFGATGFSPLGSTCFWCSWNRRKALFEAAAEHGCNKIAFGHHKDDIVQTILMNLLFEGEISAMAPLQKMFKDKISLIRPLAYVEEKEIEELARLNSFPLPACSCPNGKTSKRALVRNFINELQGACPSVKTNIFKSLKNIKQDYLLNEPTTYGTK